MSRDQPALRAIKLLSLVERHPTGLRVNHMTEQLDAIPRAIYRDLEILQKLPVPLSEKTLRRLLVLAGELSAPQFRHVHGRAGAGESPLP